MTAAESPLNLDAVDHSVADICVALGWTYTEDGVAIFMGAANATFDGQRPIDVCRTADGRRKVYDRAVFLSTGAMG